jgi:hypothetical protein
VSKPRGRNHFSIAQIRPAFAAQPAERGVGKARERS